MKVKTLIALAIITLGACSGLKKMGLEESGLSDYYFQKYIGGTEASGINAVYFIRMEADSEAQVDSLVVEGLSTLKAESKKQGLYTMTTELMSNEQASQIKFEQAKLYLHKGDCVFFVPLENIPEKASIMMPSIDGQQEPH